MLTETMSLARARDFPRFRVELLATYPWISVPDDPWPLIHQLQSALAASAAHACMSVADLLVAATAIRHGLTVLHADDDFVTAAQAFPELAQEKLPPVA